MSVRYFAFGNEPERIESVGMVLCDREENHYDDSDFYSHVYDPEKKVVQKNYVWTTRFPRSASATVDAYTGEHQEEIKAALVNQLLPLVKSGIAGLNRKALDEAFTPKKGDYVKVVKGRKVPIGTEGVVIWTGTQSYSHYQARYGTPDLRVGIKDANGDVHWTNAKNVVVEDATYEIIKKSDDEIIAHLQTLSLQDLHSILCSGTAALPYIGNATAFALIF